MFGISSQIDDKFREFAGKLPHGSGIDSDWNAHETKDYVYFTNSFYCMNQHGYYDGWQDFSIRVDRVVYDYYLDAVSKMNRYNYQPVVETAKDRANALIGIMAENFTLQFNNGHYLADKHFLCDYLEDTIYWSILEMKVK